MTAQELLDNTLALLLTDASKTPEYAASAPALINMLLRDIFDANEMLREKKGKTPLHSLAVLASLRDRLPCEEEFCQGALPYGLCAKLLVEDDDMAKAAWFHNQFADAVRCAAGTLTALIGDCYAEGDKA